MAVQRLRQIIQLVGATGPATGANQAQAFALCDDGTVWRLERDTAFDKLEWTHIDVTVVETAVIPGR
jgi:hypothetical protein